MKNGKILDKILTYCVENSEKNISSEKILKELFTDEYNIEHILLLFENISTTKFANVNISDYGDSIQSNGLTESFLNQGGFTKLEKKQNKAIDLITRKEKIEFELAKSNIKANKLNKKIAKQNTKKEKQNNITTWINIIIGILNAILIAWQISKT